MAITRSAPELELARAAPVPADENSLGELATRLAQQSVALAGVELRRLGAEVRHRRRYAARVLVTAILTTWLAVLGVMALAGGAILYLGRLWQDYAAGAAATGVLLLLVASGAAWFLISASRGLTRALPERGPDAPERNGSDGT